MDNVNLQWVASSYLSRSADQVVPSKINFEKVTFSKGLSAPKAWVPGALGGLNLEEFLSSTLRHDRQRFEAVEFEEIEVIGALEVDCPINFLNLTSDVMRKDILKNVFKGGQKVRSLNTKDLFTPEGTYIQGVSTFRWLKNLIHLNEPNEIFGTKTFKNIQIQSNLHLEHPLFGDFLISEDHILTHSGTQLIKAPKNFENLLEIKNLKLNGFLNGLNLTKFIDSQVIFKKVAPYYCH